MALDGVLKLSLYLSLFVRNCPLKCPRRNLQNETYCYGQAQTKTPETLVVSGVLQVSGINSALGELRCATSGFEAVLNISMVRFSLILRAFSHFLLLVVLFLNHRNR